MRIRHALVLGALLVVTPTAANAQPATAPSLADRETARGLMDDGDKKRDSGDLKSALASYEKADALMKVPSTAIEVARTQIALNLFLEARETLNRIAKIPVKPGEPAPFTAARKAADQLNTDLAARIPTVVVMPANTEPGQPTSISIDGEDIPPAAQIVPRKVNPGPHSTTVKSGALEKKVDFTVAEKENKTVNVDVKDQPKPVVTAPPPPPPTPSGMTTGKMLTFGGFSVGVVGLALGTITGIMSLSKTSTLKDRCPQNKCPAGKQDDIDSATTLGNVSTVGFIVGGVGAAVGVVGLVLWSKESKAQKENDAPASAPAAAFQPTNVRAVLGPSYAGLAGQF